MGERRGGDGLPGSQASTIFLLLYDGLLWRTLLVLHLRKESAGMLLFSLSLMSSVGHHGCSVTLHTT